MEHETQPSSTIPVALGLLRIAGGALGGFLIAKGYITAEDAPALGGAALTAGVAVLSAYQKIKATKRLRKAIAAPAGKVE